MNGAIDASWKGAATLSLDMDFTYRRPAAEPTTVYVAQDHGYLDVAFHVVQRETFVATQVTNGSGVLNDDNVAVLLRPQGTQGFSYGFYANAHGARYQYSTENAAYAPDWTAAARRTADGYDVTMRIPLHVIRSGSSKAWRTQFIRSTVSTNGLSVWAYSPRAQSWLDASFIGVLRGIGGAVGTRPQFRAQPYVLGELLPRVYGGDTSRAGLDAAIPVSPTSSFLASLHPDYSNVETDQQSISPTVFQRQFYEVRPFFTQAGQFFNDRLWCADCPIVLYTPAIPTFAQGYAYEGTQGPLSFAAFDAIGDQRSDNAEVLNASEQNSDRAWLASVQRVDVLTPFFMDDATTFNSGYWDKQSDIGVYENAGIDRGTYVTDPSEGYYLETGAFYSTSTSSVGVTYQHIGSQFSPIDAYLQQNAIGGYETFASHTWNLSPTSRIQSVYAGGGVDRWIDPAGQLAQIDSDEYAGVNLRDLLGLSLYSVYEGVRIPDGEFLPFSTPAVSLNYRGSTSTPTYLSYSQGAYYHGFLDTWSYYTTLQLAPRLHVSVETDEDSYETRYAGESSSRQWLERSTLDWQMSRFAQLDLGLRRIVGTNIPTAYELLSLRSPSVCAENPYYPGCLVSAGNITAAFHFLAGHNEFYAVYGDPNSLSTYPALFFKWIRYIGAEKGT